VHFPIVKIIFSLNKIEISNFISKNFPRTLREIKASKLGKYIQKGTNSFNTDEHVAEDALAPTPRAMDKIKFNDKIIEKIRI